MEQHRSTSNGGVNKLASVLDEYAARGTLRELCRLETPGGTTEFRFHWFRDREFGLRVDPRRARLVLHNVLPSVAPRSPLDRDLRAWLTSRQSATLPAHRRIDAIRLALGWRNQAGVMQLNGALGKDADWRYAARKLVHLLNELYIDFLPSSQHLDWLIETFDLDPDNPRWP